MSKIEYQLSPEALYLIAFKKRIQQRIDFNLKTGCWVWLKCQGVGGYGLVSFRGKSTTVHRASYICHKGEIPEGLIVRHTCDNPPCCNPDHLKLGTRQDNTDDMREKNRHPFIKSEGYFTDSMPQGPRVIYVDDIIIGKPNT